MPSTNHAPSPVESSINPLQLGLISLHVRVPRTHTHWTVPVQLGGVSGQLHCTADPTHGGVPHGLDHDLLHALLALDPPPTGVLCTTIGELLSLAHLRPDGHHYRAVRAGLQRLHTTTYTLTHPERRTFRLIQDLSHHGAHVELRLSPLLTPHRTAEAELTSLPGPQARALLRLLDAHRPPHQPRFTVPLQVWADVCKLTDRKSTKIRRLLDAAHAPLTAHGYLQAVTYEGRGARQTLTYTFAHPTPSALDAAVLAALTRTGMAPGPARSLLERYGAPRVEERVQRWRAILAGGYRARNPVALLVDVIRDDTGKYPKAVGGPDPVMLAERQERSEAQRERQAEQQDRARAAEWAGLSAAQRRARALRTVTLLLGGRLTPHTSQLLHARLERGEVTPEDLLRQAVRATAEHTLDDFARALADDACTVC